MEVSQNIRWIGVNDHEVDLFEGQFPVPEGMAYNSYLILDEKPAVMDSVDAHFAAEWLEKIDKELGGQAPAYLIVQHMEPDHSGSIAAFAEKYPETTIVSSAAAFRMMKNFFKTEYAERRVVVGEGSTLSLGSHELQFITAPMVHWPEVIMTYEKSEKTLFSADAFGKFGAHDMPREEDEEEEDGGWACEARRYYFGIVGKFGAQVQSLLKKAAGLDMLYDCSPKPLTPAPKGYEPVYISHYGRHGSRYAYTAKTYSVLLEMLRKGARTGNLTPRGQKLLEDLEAFWEAGQYKVGDLTPLGWQQHRWIARNMVRTFPSVFKKGSSVDACSSSSIRSVISMSSCCASISREAPEADVYEHQGILDIQATRPNQGKNPFEYAGPANVFPYPESSTEYFYRRFPGYKEPLGRIFRDPAAGLGDRNAYDVFFYYYMFVVGMNSLPDEEKIDVSGLFTDEELALLWETDSYERLREYLPYRTPCSSIVDDIIAKADQRIAVKSRGADLRFGHDHVMMALLMIMDIDGFGYLPAKADDFIDYFRTFRSPMATNLQFVFYAPRHGKRGDILVKVLHNGEEVRLGNLEPFDGPYYVWEGVKAYFNKRTSLFVNR